MVTFLITSFFILAIAAIAIYFWQKPDTPKTVARLTAAAGSWLVH